MGSLDCLVSVIVLNWNGEEVVEPCLDSVAAQTHESIEMIVVDNGSTDKSLDLVRSRFPTVKIIELGRNVGFAAGMNAGIRESRGNVIIPLNVDVRLEHDFVERSIAVLGEYPQAGSLACASYLWREELDRQSIDHLGLFLRPDVRYVDCKQGHKRQFVFGPVGSAPVLRRTMLQDVFATTGHYYDDGYFMYFEDMDLWMRAQLLGWRCLYEPSVVSYHKQSAIAGAVSLFDKSDRIVRCAVRNRFATIVKNLPLPVLLLLLPVLVAVEPLDWLRAMLASTPRLRILLDGYVSFFRDIPHLILQRRRIQSARRVSVCAVFGWFRLRLH